MAQQEGQPADVIFVAVGEHARLDPIAIVEQVGEIGQDEVDTGHLGVGEHEAAIEDEDAARDFDARAVATDLAQPTEEDQADRSSGISQGRSHRRG